MKMAMAQNHLRLGNKKAAANLYREILSDEPDNTDAAFALSRIYIAIKRPGLAAPLLENVIRLDPGHIQAHIDFSKIHYALGQTEEALDLLSSAEAVSNDNVYSLVILANEYLEKCRASGAERCLLRALEIDSNQDDIHKRLGLIYRDMGQADQAIKCLKKSLELNPDCAEAHFSLSYMKENITGSDEIGVMEALYAADTLPGKEKTWLAFGLGKAYEDTGEFDKAFEFYAQANGLEVLLRSKPQGDQKANFENIKSHFTEDFIDRHRNSGDQSDSPIFIVGMPRSGISLVEQILASHQDVYGAGELVDIHDLSVLVSTITKKHFPFDIGGVGDQQWQQLAKQYLVKLAGISGRLPRFTDKMPDNFLYIGLISVLFPNAKIIHCKRNPMDTCLSLFRNCFAGGYAYSYDLLSLGEHYNRYTDLMRHWHHVLPFKIYDVSYEDLIDNTEEEVRALLNYCGLTFDQACLEFYNTDRVVATASASQVRRPISRKSVDSWQRFEKQLQPLSEVLGLVSSDK